MINERDIALIDAFIAGKLIGNDKTDFENRVKKDLEFAKAVRQQIHAVEHLEILGAVSMGKSLRSDMQQWKSQGGYKPYKPELIGKGMMAKAIAAIVLLAAVGGIIWYFFLKEKPTKPEPVKPEVEETVVPEPTPTADAVDTSSTTEALVELKTSEEQIADMQLNVKDPATFSIHEISEENGIYTYQIAYDDYVDVFQSRDPDIDDTLMEMAEEAIAENQRISDENRARNNVVRQKSVQSTPTPPPTEKKVETKKQPAPKPKPRRKQQKVDDDFPY
ncbi:MAG: hypothetical protein KC517_10710 [Bacteroidetes bacterium]|nr:hypothetical protein [Bacteroidota bacterium]